MLLYKLTSLLGLFIFMAAAWAVSEDRRAMNARLIAWGVGLQFLFALLILKTYPGMFIFDAARAVLTGLLDYTAIGAGFIFGNLSKDPSFGAMFAFRVLPTIIFVSSVMGVLFYIGALQGFIKGFAWVMRRTMRASGLEAFMSAAFVFMGIEAATGARAYVKGMTRSELFTVMTGFMATIAGSVMAAYVSFGADAGHLLAASVMSAPAAIVISKIMVPEKKNTENAAARDETLPEIKSDDINIIEAAANGAETGLKLALSVGALLLAFVSIIGMMDSLLGYGHTSFKEITGYLFSPVAFIMGVPWEDSLKVGELLGVKVVFNEFLSYQMLQPHIQNATLSPRAVVIATYALCSFANFGSLAILIGGLGGLVPERKKEIASLGLKSIAAGCMAGFMTATIAGVIV